MAAIQSHAAENDFSINGVDVKLDIKVKTDKNRAASAPFTRLHEINASDTENAITFNTFPALAKSKNPNAWDARQFCEEVTDPKSGLDYLSQARITQIIRLREHKAIGAHEYVLLRVRTDTEHFGSAMHEVWFRCERMPSGNDPFNTLLTSSPSSNDVKSLDTIKFSFKQPTLYDKSDTVKQDDKFMDLRVEHLIDLLRNITSHAPSYRLSSTNCRWFAKMLSNVPQANGKSGWDFKSCREWVESVCKDNVPDATRKVAWQYINKWNPPPQITIPLIPASVPNLWRSGMNAIRATFHLARHNR